MEREDAIKFHRRKIYKDVSRDLSLSKEQKYNLETMELLEKDYYPPRLKKRKELEFDASYYTLQ
jgi:hypothetical protein